jgi:hypothetical protein
MIGMALHQGEEFVVILPAIMLAGAFFIMRWANQQDESQAEDDARRQNSEALSEDELDALSVAAVGHVSVEPPHERDSEDQPDHHHRNRRLAAERPSESEYEHREREHAEKK